MEWFHSLAYKIGSTVLYIAIGLPVLWIIYKLFESILVPAYIKIFGDSLNGIFKWSIFIIYIGVMVACIMKAIESDAIGGAVVMGIFILIGFHEFFKKD